MTTPERTIVVTGATGRQGGAVSRHLLRSGWRVRALTRRPDRPRARELERLGAEVVRADLADTDAVHAALHGAYGVFNVQNPMISGIDGELEQGFNVGNAAAAAGVQHLVYASAGTGTPGTGVPSWESKLAVKAHLQRLGLPLTVLRPLAFMELMTDKNLFPAMAVWSVMPKIMGADRPVPWICVDDVGAIAARAFAEPERFIGAELPLAVDVRTIDECRALWQEASGRSPRRVPMPVWLFERFTGNDLTTMWQWLHDNPFTADPGPTRELLPGALTVPQWLATHRPN